MRKINREIIEQVYEGMLIDLLPFPSEFDLKTLSEKEIEDKGLFAGKVKNSNLYLLKIKLGDHYGAPVLKVYFYRTDYGFFENELDFLANHIKFVTGGKTFNLKKIFPDLDWNKYKKTIEGGLTC